MKIAVNTRLLIKERMDGIAWFTYETLKRIVKNHPEHEFIFLFDRKWDEDFVFANNVTPVSIMPQARHPFLYYWWFNFSVSKILKKYKVDLFLSPDGFLSQNTNVPQISVIHDINFHHFPRDFKRLDRYYYNYFFPRFAKIAKRIATVSNFSKEDIASAYNVPLQKIDVVYNGVNTLYQPENEEEKTKTRLKFTMGHPFFVFVGTMIPRKNISRLMLAFDESKKQGNFPHRLFLIGNRKWWTNKMEKTFKLLKHKNHVVFKDWTSPLELKSIYAAAEALVFVPYFEGFGIPIIEAMKSGTPVITSNVSSMPEVAGKAALLADPFDINSISKQILRLVENKDNLKEKLINAGFERSKNFSWDTSAEKLWECMINAVNKKSH